MGKVAGIGLGPSGYVEGGGLLDNVVVDWTEVRFEMFDYGGQSDSGPVPALRVTFTPEDGEPSDQYFSAGKAEDWEPSKDGTTLVAVGNAKGINKSCNMAILIHSLIEAGFPEDKIEDDCTVFEGMITHVVRVPAPKRPGLVVRTRADGRTFEKTNLVVDKIIKLPWEKSGKRTGATGSTKQEEKPEAGETIEDKAVAAVIAAVSGAGGALDKKKLGTVVYGDLKGDPDRSKIVQLIYDDKFLSKNGPWEYKNGKVSMG